MCWCSDSALNLQLAAIQQVNMISRWSTNNGLSLTIHCSFYINPYITVVNLHLCRYDWEEREGEGKETRTLPYSQVKTFSINFPMKKS